MAEAALGLAGRGHDVEVLTTCAVDHYSWANELPAGVCEESGVLVRRFPVVRHPSRVALRAQWSIQSGRLPDLDEQVSWLGFQFSSPGLFEHLLRRGESYDAVVFSPYIFWTTAACLPLVAERAVVMPCLHDEGYARLDVFRPVFAAPAAVWFLSGPEHHLAHRLGPVAARHSVTGAGVPVPTSYDPAGFMAGHGLERPFALVAGRREEGKGTPWLLRSFAAAVAEAGADLDLVVIGKGGLGAVPEGVVDLGFVSDGQRDDAFAAATVYVQPSRMESFSRTVMEAWLAGTPVIARAGSEVVEWHLG
ncbi:MAG: glycosyltransferase, partial [Acidimicrobiales bacterium]